METIDRLRSLESLPGFEDVSQIRPEYRKHWRTEFGDGELLCREFVDEIARCLTSVVREGDVILEIGAGSGRMSHFLREETGFEIVAIDNNRAWIPACHAVERFEVREAYNKFKPTILIASWPPEDMPWGPIPRSIREIILIGEPGECGHDENWQVPEGFIVLSLGLAKKYQQSVSSRSTSVIMRRMMV